jgi:acetyl esterase
MAFEDIPYREIGGERILGRLFRAAEERAAVVEVHGGAWTMNDRTTNVVIHEHLAAHGVSVFALDFRMAPAHRFPRAVEDVNYAVRWLKANAQRLGLKAKRFGGVGTSSGGHLLVLSSLQPQRFAIAEPSLAGHDPSLEFLIAGWPILDPLARYRMARAKGLKTLVEAHRAFWPDEAAMAEGNPQAIVEGGQAQSRPPMLVLQGTADENVEPERADRFATAYRAAGGEIELVKFSGQPHTFIPKAPTAPASIEALERMVKFIEART